MPLPVHRDGSTVRMKSYGHPQTAFIRAGRAPVFRPRRGTVMVFVLGILTLLALIGIALVSTTQVEAQRTAIQSDAVSNSSLMDGAIRTAQDFLRQDIWGPEPPNGVVRIRFPLDNSGAPNTGVTPQVNKFGIEENNEPFDSPEADRWLASLAPYLLLSPAGVPLNVPTEFPQTANPPPGATESLVLVWPDVSYLGTDLLRPLTDPLPQPPALIVPVNNFAWDRSTRISLVGDVALPPLRYGPDSLRNIPILQTPPPNQAGGSVWAGYPFRPGPYGIGAPLIPGSTTNVTIAEARRRWSAIDWSAVALPPGLVPQFPYFDTNADGIVDLYDADGDGIPDSPISYAISVDTRDPNAARRLYVVARVVDHSGMINTNTAFSWNFPTNPNGSGMMFDESVANLQRRGRRVTELLLDPIAHHNDRLAGAANRLWNLINFRTGNTSVPNDPFWFDVNVARRELVGGLTGNFGYVLHGLANEASLRHRGLLSPYEYREFDKFAQGVGGTGTDYNTIDKALRWTLLWTRGWQGQYPDDVNYLPASARWSRFNSDYSVGLPGNPTNDRLYEGYDDPTTGLGWRTLLIEDEPFALRRHMVTTVSHAVEPPPNIVRGVAGAGADPGLAALNNRLIQLRALGMDWPVLGAAGFTPPPWMTNPPGGNPAFGLSLSAVYSNIAGITAIPAHLRPQRIDLNMSRAVFPDSEAARADFIRYLAAATWLSLENVTTYQGMTLNASIRARLAWQLALNTADFRDTDNVPTRLTLPAGLAGNPTPVTLFGAEKQPFFTESWSRLKAENADPPDPANDDWFDAVELYIPPLWMIDGNRLFVRIPDYSGGARIIPLSAFRRLDPAAGWTPDLTDTLVDDLNGGGPGGPGGDVGAGRYVVLCSEPGLVGGIPPQFANMVPPPDNFYAVPQTGNPLDQFEHVHANRPSRVELIYSNATAGPLVAADPMTHVLDVIDSQAGPAPWQDGFSRQTIGTPVGQNDEYVFSLKRSTRGWRFTTAWHDSKLVQTPNAANNPDMFTLGKPNHDPITLTSYTASLDGQNGMIPESPWPFRSSTTLDANPYNNYMVPNGFGSGQPYEAFESVAELSRMYLFGNTNHSAATNTPALVVAPNVPTPAPGPYTSATCITEQLARAVNGQLNPGDLPQNPQDRIAAGRIDWVNASVPTFVPPLVSDGQPWTWRLFNLLTTTSPLFDRIDNDGNGPANVDIPADPTEAYKILSRVAGRLNVNTATLTALRAVPFMSLLPTSPEFLTFGPQPPPANKVQLFNQNPSLFWDMATAIVARREERRAPSFMTGVPGQPVPIPVRLPSGNAATPLPAVALASLPPAIGGPAIPDDPNRFGYANLAELSRVVNVNNSLTGAAPGFFRVDRYTSDNTVAMGNHNPPAPGAANPIVGVQFNPASGEPYFSPDFRFRRPEGAVSEVVDYTPTTAWDLGLGSATGVDTSTSAGIRGRDVYLARWSNVLTTRSDVFTAYFALIDEEGRYVARRQVTFDRSECFRENPNVSPRVPVLPKVLLSVDLHPTDDAN